MKIRNEKGFAGTDIAISVIIITIFISLIANLISNINLNSKETERKTLATSYAIEEIQKIKSKGINEYIGKGIEEEYTIEEDIKNGEEFSGFHKKIIVKDYVLIKQDETKQKDVLKEILVEISYKVGKKERKVNFSTYITRETNYEKR